jgi:hypothetical protein
VRKFLIALVAMTFAVGGIDIAAATALEAGDPPPQLRTRLRGVPLRSPSRLKLMTDFEVLDVDRGTRRVIEGLSADPGSRWAQRANGHLVITDDCLDCKVRPTVYVVRRGRYAAERIATGVFVTPGRRGLWAKSYETATSCTLGKISLTGETLVTPRPFACNADVIGENALGLVISFTGGWALLDQTDLREIARGKVPSRVHAVTSRRVLVRDAEGFALVDPRTGAETRIAEPRSVGHPGNGSVSRDGRYIAIEYRDPSQFMDLWILDLETTTWMHAPSMPVHAMIKRPEPSWTPDGRLVVLGWFGERSKERHLLVVWRPGKPKLSIRPMTKDARFVV